MASAVPLYHDSPVRICGDRRDVLAQFGVVDGPRVTQVLLQRLGLVLREHENAAQSGMKAVAEREIDDAISSAEGHGRFGPLGSQWMQARTNSARQNDADRLILHNGLRSMDQQIEGSPFGEVHRSGTPHAEFCHPMRVRA